MSQPTPSADDTSGDFAMANKLLWEWDSFAAEDVFSRRRPPNSAANMPHEILLAYPDTDLLLLVDHNVPFRLDLARTAAAVVLQDIWAKQQVATTILAMRALAATGREVEAQRLERIMGDTDRLAAHWLRAQIIYGRVALAGMLIGFLVAPIMAVLIGLSWLSFPWSGWMIVAVGLAYLLVALALSVMRRQKSAVVAALFVVTLFGSIFGMTLGVVNLPRSEVWSGFVFILGATISFDLILFIPAPRAIEWIGRSHLKESLLPQTALIYHFLSAYAAARVWEEPPWAPPVWEERPLRLMELTSRLEDAASRAELEFTGRKSSGDSEVQAWLHRFGTTIGAVIREHKKIALEVPWSARTRVSRSLLNGLAHLLRGDLARLLVVEVPTTHRSLWNRYGGRVVITAALVVGGIGLPVLLPDLIANPVEFRATAFVTAFFSLLAPDPKAAAEALKAFKP
jgi:hypothetical protein